MVLCAHRREWAITAGRECQVARGGRKPWTLQSSSVFIFVVVHSVVSDSATRRLQQARLPPHHQLPEFTQTHVHWVGDAIQPSHPLLSPSPPAFILPSTRVFSNESAFRIRWPKYWSFSIGPSNEYSGLISFRTDCPRDSQESSPAPQFLRTQPSLWPNSHICT